MMRKILSVAVFACAMALAGTAGAGVTVDLIWEDTGTPTLDVTVAGDPGQNTNCSGFNNPGVVGRCLRVLWTTDEPIFIGSNSIAWDTSTGLQGQFASFFPNFNAIGVGKASAFLAFPNPSVTVNNISGTAGLFTGAVNQVPPGDGVTGLPAGTYLVGTIVFDTTNVGGNIAIGSTIQVGLDGFVDLVNATITDVTLNAANYSAPAIPEPGTASLLGLGLIGLVAAGRNRNRK